METFVLRLLSIHTYASCLPDESKSSMEEEKDPINELTLCAVHLLSASVEVQLRVILFLLESAGDYTYSWILGSDEAGQASQGDVFKIYIVGQRADGRGYVDDKSNSPFGFSVGLTTVSSVMLDEKLVAKTLAPKRVLANVPKVRTQMAAVINVVESLLNNIKNGFVR